MREYNYVEAVATLLGYTVGTNGINALIANSLFHEVI